MTGVLSEVVDRRAGLITVSGHLTSSGADLVRGTADQLCGAGHARVVLDLRGVGAADDDGLAVLQQLHHDFRVEPSVRTADPQLTARGGGRGIRTHEEL